MAENKSTGKRLADSGKVNQKKSPVTDLFYWAEALVFALTFLVLLSVFFVRFSGVDGSSMLPTLVDNDQVLVQLIGYDEPERGDIVVVYAPYFENEPLVKRVIAKGGDVVDIDPNTGAVSVNGEQLVEPYISEPLLNAGTLSYPYEVPEGQVFVMGDNRNNSTDSRDDRLGPIDQGYVLGKVVLAIWPLSRLGLM